GAARQPGGGFVEPAGGRGWRDRGEPHPPAELAPAGDVARPQGVLDEAADGRPLEVAQDGQDGGQATVVVEVVVHAEPGRGDGGHGGVLLEDVVVLAGVHLHHRVAFGDGTLHLGPQLLRGHRLRPGGDGDPPADLLPQQPVGGDVQLLPHQVVEGGAEPGVQVVAQELEGTTPDQGAGDGGVRGRAAVVPVAGQPVVRAYAEDGTHVPGGEVGVVGGCPSHQTGVDRDDVHVGDAHALLPSGGA